MMIMCLECKHWFNLGDHLKEGYDTIATCPQCKKELYVGYA
jgi:uncharacterized protein YbaR (Trm112 family)